MNEEIRVSEKLISELSQRIKDDKPRPTVDLDVAFNPSTKWEIAIVLKTINKKHRRKYAQHLSNKKGTGKAIKHSIFLDFSHVWRSPE